jgi:hypothetical protein
MAENFYFIRYRDRSHLQPDGEPGFYFIVNDRDGATVHESATHPTQDEADTIAAEIVTELEKEWKLQNA